MWISIIVYASEIRKNNKDLSVALLVDEVFPYFAFRFFDFFCGFDGFGEKFGDVGV